MKFYIHILFSLFITGSAIAQNYNFKRLDGPQSFSTFCPLSICSNGDLVTYGVYHSTDNGTTWHGPKVATPFSGGVNLFNVSPEGIILVGLSWNNADSTSNGIYRSSDYGNSWSKVLDIPLPINIASSKEGVYFIVSGLLVNTSTSPCSILRSTDKGVTWTKIQTDHEWCTDIKFDSSNNVYYSTQEAIYVTNINFSNDKKFGILPNHPDSWHLVKKLFCLPNGQFIASQDIHSYLNTELLSYASGNWKPLCKSIPETDQLVGTADGLLWSTRHYDAYTTQFSKPILYRSSDGGATWDSVPNIPFSRQTNISISTDGKDKLFVGAYNGIFMTSDGGKTWTTVGIPASNITSLAINRSGLIFAKHDYYNHINISYNNGKTWIQSDPDPQNVYQGPLGPGPRGSVIAPSFYGDCFGKNMWEFTDLETGTWEELSPIPAGVGYGQTFVVTDKSNNIYVSVYPEGVYQSTDEGVTWELLSMPSSGSIYYSMTVAPDSALYIGSQPGIYYSTDEGKTWGSINHSIINTKISALCAPKSNMVLAGTSTKGLYKTTDNGLNWYPWGHFADSITSIIATKDSTIFVGTSRELYACKLGSNNWVKQDLHDELLGVSCMALGGSDAILVGTTSGLWYAPLQTSAVKQSSMEESEFTLLSNPVTSTVDILYTGKEINGMTSLMLQNILGETVSALSTQASTKYSLDIHELPTGVYFLTILTTDNTTNLKIVKK